LEDCQISGTVSFEPAALIGEIDVAVVTSQFGHPQTLVERKSLVVADPYIYMR
jgi:hypothetical protein